MSLDSGDSSLSGFRVAILATDGFEESELTEPLNALTANEARVDVISPQSESGRIQAFHHHEKTCFIKVDRNLSEVKPSDYEALVLPGGALNADQMRVNPQVIKFVRAHMAADKPMAVICHAPWILISAGLVTGRRMTSYRTIRDDVIRAGAEWVDETVVIDGSLVTSRKPDDLPAFNREMIRVFSEKAKRLNARAA